MASVALPTSPGNAGFSIAVLDFGGELTPPLGGPVQRINRLGNRYQLQVTLPPIRSASAALAWTTRLETAKYAGAIYPVPLDYAPGSPGSVVVANAVGGGTSVYLGGFAPGYVLREGQWGSFVHGGRRYLHRAAANATANASGNLTMTLATMLRTPLSVSDVVEIAVPMIEGLLVGSIGWEAMIEPYTRLGFTIAEAE